MTAKDSPRILFDRGLIFYPFHFIFRKAISSSSPSHCSWQLPFAIQERQYRILPPGLKLTAVTSIFTPRILTSCSRSNFDLYITFYLLIIVQTAYRSSVICGSPPRLDFLGVERMFGIVFFRLFKQCRFRLQRVVQLRHFLTLTLSANTCF